MKIVSSVFDLVLKFVIVVIAVTLIVLLLAAFQLTRERLRPTPRPLPAASAMWTGEPYAVGWGEKWPGLFVRNCLLTIIHAYARI